MAKVTAMQPQKTKPSFDPQVNYKWEPTDLFEITGQQLASLYHCLTREVNVPEGAPVIMKYEAFSAILDIFKRGVEQGVIVEAGTSVEEGLVDKLDNDVNNLFKG